MNIVSIHGALGDESDGEDEHNGQSMDFSVVEEEAVFLADA